MGSLPASISSVPKLTKFVGSQKYTTDLYFICLIQSFATECSQNLNIHFQNLMTIWWILRPYCFFATPMVGQNISPKLFLPPCHGNFNCPPQTRREIEMRLRLQIDSEIEKCPVGRKRVPKGVIVDLACIFRVSAETVKRIGSFYRGEAVDQSGMIASRRQLGMDGRAKRAVESSKRRIVAISLHKRRTIQGFPEGNCTGDDREKSAWGEVGDYRLLYSFQGNKWDEKGCCWWSGISKGIRDGVGGMLVQHNGVGFPWVREVLPFLRCDVFYFRCYFVRLRLLSWFFLRLILMSFMLGQKILFA